MVSFRVVAADLNRTPCMESGNGLSSLVNPQQCNQWLLTSFPPLRYIVEWFEAGHYSTCQSLPACAYRGNHNVFYVDIETIQGVYICFFRK